VFVQSIPDYYTNLLFYCRIGVLIDLKPLSLRRFAVQNPTDQEPAIALKKLKDNPRVRDIRLVVSADCCPVCASYEGTYQKDEVPTVPIEGCSHPNGCRCFYEPMLNELYP